eukprot:m.188408 g.188408  ORF g.188408 m.188408 type:complete len:649 (+) comp17536_c0_seq2:118-2064(+)
MCDEALAKQLGDSGLAALKDRVPQLALLLNEFDAELRGLYKLKNTPFESDAEYWRLAELDFTMRMLLISSQTSLRRTLYSKDGVPVEVPDLVERLSATIRSTATARILASIASKEKKPRIISLQELYQLSQLEVELYSLLVLKQSAKSLACRSWLAEYGVDAVGTMLADLCGATEVELDWFYSEERPHIKEGVILVDMSMENLRVPRVPPDVARAIVGEHQLNSEQRLKLAMTAVLTVAEESERQSQSSLSSNSAAFPAAAAAAAGSHEGSDDDDVDDDEETRDGNVTAAGAGKDTCQAEGEGSRALENGEPRIPPPPAAAADSTEHAGEDANDAAASRAAGAKANACKSAVSKKGQQVVPLPSGFGEHVTPIGVLRSCFREKNGTPRQGVVCPESRASLTLTCFNNPEHSLEGLAAYSHAWLLFIFHKNNNVAVKAKVSPPRLNGKKVGLFATRTPHRPNPIGLSLVRIERVEGRTVFFSGIDLIDGTPVLDVKPYIPYCDRPPEQEVRVAEWLDAPPVAPLNVLFTDQALQELRSLESSLVDFSTAEQAAKAITAILQGDPRSVYRRQYCLADPYIFHVDSLKVSADFLEGAARVNSVALTAPSSDDADRPHKRQRQSTATPAATSATTATAAATASTTSQAEAAE